MNSITLFIHIYYPGSWKMIRDKCAHILGGAGNVIVSACHDEVIEEIMVDMPQAHILKVPNKGKDIGGKLAAISYYLNFCEQTEYLAFLHDKISPQTLNSGYWFDKLYQIFQEKEISKISRLFRKNKKIGIAGSKSFLRNEYIRSSQRFNTTNDSILSRLIKKFKLGSRHHNYIGGTIFIARNEIFRHFFTQNRPLEIREELETGNVLDLKSGTYTHSWERLLCFIAQNQGYKVIGV